MIDQNCTSERSISNPCYLFTSLVHYIIPNCVNKIFIPLLTMSWMEALTKHSLFELDYNDSEWFRLAYPLLSNESYSGAIYIHEKQNWVIQVIRFVVCCTHSLIYIGYRYPFNWRKLVYLRWMINGLLFLHKITIDNY